MENRLNLAEHGCKAKKCAAAGRVKRLWGAGLTKSWHLLTAMFMYCTVWENTAVILLSFIHNSSVRLRYSGLLRSLRLVYSEVYQTASSMLWHHTAALWGCRPAETLPPRVHPAVVGSTWGDRLQCWHPVGSDWWRRRCHGPDIHPPGCKTEPKTSQSDWPITSEHIQCQTWCSISVSAHV